MASKRRYQPIVKYPVYSREFDRLRLESEILNPDPRPTIHSILWDRSTLKNELLRIITEVKPVLLQKLKNLEIEFQNLQTDCRNQGREIPAEMPTAQLHERYKIEASLDVVEEEKQLLAERLKTFTDKIEKEYNENMLKYGLVCRSHNHGTMAEDWRMMNVMKEIDGQNVSFYEGILIIDDGLSPYNGMAVCDYRKLARIWIENRNKAEQELLLRMQKDAKERGEDIPRSTGLSPNRSVSKKDLPPFPEWAKNYKTKKIEKAKK